MLLREVVSNFQESGDRSKNSAFFLFTPKDPFGELFSKMTFKSSSESLFWQKIRKFEIGQNLPNLHDFYRAFSAFSQRSNKTTKNYKKMADSQFALSNQNIVEQLKENAKTKNTLKATQTWLNVWQTWATQRKVNPKMEEYEHEQLDKMLE